MTKPVYLGLSTLELSKILRYGFCYDCAKLKYIEKAQLCDKDTDNFLIYIKTDDIFKGNCRRCSKIDLILQISRYQKEKCRKVIKLMKDELGGKMIIKFVGLRAKTYNYFINEVGEDNRAKGAKTCVIKKQLKNYKNYVEAAQLENNINHQEKSN